MKSYDISVIILVLKQLYLFDAIFLSGKKIPALSKNYFITKFSER